MLDVGWNPHCEELPGLHINGFHVLVWPAIYTDMESDDWQSHTYIHTDGMDLVLPNELDLQDLSGPFMIL